MNIYVGNLPYTVEEEELRQVFEPFGQVASAKVIMDRATGRSKGFGFVEMANNEEAQSAISGLNEQEFKGRTLRVNEARPRADGDRGDDRRY